MNWIDNYKSKLTTAEQALKVVKSNSSVFVHPGTAEPEILVRAMVARAPELKNVKIYHILTFGYAGYADPGMEEHFRHVSLFTGGNVRKAINEGRADYMPIFLGEIGRLFYSGAIKLDVALIHVSPPDEHGFCSFGVGIDVTLAAAEVAKVVIAQVNPQMPRTLGNSFIHIDKIDHIVEVDTPILEANFGDGKISSTSLSIGKHIANLVEDGACLQLGIGEIPDAVLKGIVDRRDLGMHTEMFSDGVIDLLEKGALTNARKTLHKGKAVAAFVLGTKRLNKFIHNNPLFEFHPNEYTNDPFIIAQNDNMVSVNSAIEVDLTGQVVSDSIGYNIYSGFGGQVDFVRGASRSKNGKTFIALASSTKNDTVSKIVPHIQEGAGVVTCRADVHYVVTEYGVAYLHGKTIRERVKALINIAHPNFKEELERFAKTKNWL
jgi:4-hydroxybutyrate CoA-transferase